MTKLGLLILLRNMKKNLNFQNLCYWQGSTAFRWPLIQWTVIESALPGTITSADCATATTALFSSSLWTFAGAHRTVCMVSHLTFRGLILERVIDVPHSGTYAYEHDRSNNHVWIYRFHLDRKHWIFDPVRSGWLNAVILNILETD